ARAASTAIYFLLARGEHSHWHRIDAAEVWHYYAGAPISLKIAAPITTKGQAPLERITLERTTLERITLGPDLLAGERPQALVPAGAWRGAESLGDWTLVGCRVAPGFEFAGFELAPPGWEPG